MTYRATPAITNSGSAQPTSFSIPKQSGTVAGDWIFLWLMGAGGPTTACAGFGAVSDPNTYSTLLFRKADGTEGSSFNVTNLYGTRPITALIATVAGEAATLDPATVATPNSAPSGTTLPVNGLTLTNANDLVLWFAGNENGWAGPGFAITPPAGFTAQATNGPASANATVMLADNSSLPAGATGIETGTYTSGAGHSGVMVGLVAAAGGALAITTASLPSDDVGVAYSATLSATGGVPPYTWSISAGSLPAGMTLNGSTGVISGTPTAAGTASFTVEVTDNA